MEALSILTLLKVLIIFSMLVVCVVIHKWSKFKEKKLEMELHEININVNVSNGIDERLDNMIETCFQEYSLTELFHKSDWYITEQDEIDINKKINYLVAQRISPVMMEQLCLYYNENSITDIIAKRVYFRVTNFVIEHNKATGI